MKNPKVLFQIMIDQPSAALTVKQEERTTEMVQFLISQTERLTEELEKVAEGKLSVIVEKSLLTAELEKVKFQYESQSERADVYHCDSNGVWKLVNDKVTQWQSKLSDFRNKESHSRRQVVRLTEKLNRTNSLLNEYQKRIDILESSLVDDQVNNYLKERLNLNISKVNGKDESWNLKRDFWH